jgi:hypothetical protein
MPTENQTQLSVGYEKETIQDKRNKLCFNSLQSVK